LRTIVLLLSLFSTNYFANGEIIPPGHGVASGVAADGGALQVCQQINVTERWSLVSMGGVFIQFNNEINNITFILYSGAGAGETLSLVAQTVPVPIAFTGGSVFSPAVQGDLQGADSPVLEVGDYLLCWTDPVGPSDGVYVDLFGTTGPTYLNCHTLSSLAGSKLPILLSNSTCHSTGSGQIANLFLNVTTPPPAPTSSTVPPTSSTIPPTSSTIPPTSAAPAPAHPSSPSVVKGSTTITLSGLPTGSSAVTAVKILYRRTGVDASYTQVYSTLSSSGFVIKSLTPCSWYNVYYKIKGPSGWGLGSPIVSIKTLC